jgi:tRNA-dihydrouridine synthase B
LASTTEPGYKPVSIAGRLIPGNVFLSPMAGYTDLAFRSVCLDWGAVLSFAEMVSAEALSRGSEKTLRLLDRAEGERLIGFQIFASNPRAAGTATRALSVLSPSIIDLNCGCSVPKVLKTGCGAALMRNPALIGEIVRAMHSETDLPVSVKLRSGWDASEITYLQAAESAVSAGASMVSLHPRTRTQGFSGKADWRHISSLKSAVEVPVFGSGDLFSPQDCAGMLAGTRCDGVLIARGALGNPFIFRSIRSFLDTGELPAVTPADRLETALKHLRLLIGLKGEAVACREMRKHFVAYTKGMEGGAALRQEIVTARTLGEYERIVEAYTSSRR